MSMLQELTYTADEMMTVAAARLLHNDMFCFVGIGLPSAAANLARATHAPECVLIYESGTIGTKPTRLPLSIGDGELAETADVVVSMPEIFNYWLQAGRIDVGFLGAAQIDRYGNLNSTVIGDYNQPKVRLPGAGGAPEIASCAKETIIIIRQNLRTFVEKVDFISSVGHYKGGNSRAELGIHTKGPTTVITQLGILEPDPVTKELTMTCLHPGVKPAEVLAATGWQLRFARELQETQIPTPMELEILRDLQARSSSSAN
jgi:glutaconate CoA-transferase, subunit B